MSLLIYPSIAQRGEIVGTKPGRPIPPRRVETSSYIWADRFSVIRTNIKWAPASGAT